MAQPNIRHDRAKFHVLVVCAKMTTVSQLRLALKTLGFPNISTVNSHVAGLERAQSRNFSHYFFDAKDSDMPAQEFLRATLEIEPNATMIAVSEEPRIDDVFSLLRTGARSFLVPPFNTDTVEGIIMQASEGPPLSEAVLNAPDRNGAFVAVILNNLYRLSVAMRQAREFKTAEREVAHYSRAFRDSIEMAHLFSDGNENELQNKIIEACINRAKDAATRLGRLRKKLRRERDGSEVFEENDAIPESDRTS